MNKRIWHYIIYFALSIIPLICYLIPDLASLPVFNQPIIYLITYLNYLLLGLGIIFSFYLNQHRAALAVAIHFIIFHFSLRLDSFEAIGINSPRFLELITLAYPLALFITFFHKEVSILSLRFIRLVFLALLPFAIVAFWIADFKESYLQVAYHHFIDYFRPLEVPQVAIFPLILLILTTMIKRNDKYRPFFIVSLIAFIPFYTFAHVGMDYHFPEIGKNAIIILSYAFISAILFHAIFFMYWQRVYLDELTQIANRRALDETLSSLTGDYTLAMIDIDHFKKFNDTFGHDAGDDVLKVVAKTLEANAKKAKVFRYGGEEFTLLYKNIDLQEAFAYADELKDIIAQREFYIRQKSQRERKDRGKVTHHDKKKVQITISIGLADGDHKTPQETIKIADKGLYAAKEAGWNCVKTIEG